MPRRNSIRNSSQSNQSKIVMPSPVFSQKSLITRRKSKMGSNLREEIFAQRVVGNEECVKYSQVMNNLRKIRHRNNFRCTMLVPILPENQIIIYLVNKEKQMSFKTAIQNHEFLGERYKVILAYDIENCFEIYVEYLRRGLQIQAMFVENEYKTNKKIAHCFRNIRQVELKNVKLYSKEPATHCHHIQLQGKLGFVSSSFYRLQH